MTVQTTSLLPQIVGAMQPAANPVSGVTDDENALIVALATKMAFQFPFMWSSQAYYDGTQRLADLGVAVPPQLAGIRTVVDWPRICVDPLVERAVIDGFRLPRQTDTDTELQELFEANEFAAEFPLCMLDALTLGRGYAIVGSGDEDGDPPIVTMESPFNLAMNWDPRTKKVTAAYQAFEAEGVYRAVLYLPDVTVSMSRDGSTQWMVDDRDEHNLGEVPVVRFTNRQRTADREGRSEISPAIRNTTDSACRSLLGMEIAREFYSVPHRYILGAKEEDFQDAQGNPKTALDMVMSKFLAFERNEGGDKPEVGQFTAFDPSVYTKIIDKHAMLMSSYTQYPPEYFGQTNTANPASADAIRSAQDGMNRRGRQVQSHASSSAKNLARLVWRFAHSGEQLTPDLRRLEVDWQPVETATPAATADAMLKQVQMGAVPATSDVTLSVLGYSAVERARLAQDRAKDAAASLEAELASSLEVKEAKANKSVIADLAGDQVDPTTGEAAQPPMAMTPPDGMVAVSGHIRKRPGKSPGK